MSASALHLLPRAAGLAMLFVAACHRQEPTPAALPAASSAASVAPDRLEPNELAEGTEIAFKLKLPRGMQVTFRGPFEVRAEGNIEADRVANYIRKHMHSDGVEVGAARTIFGNARVRGDPQAPACQVEVIASGTRTRLIIRDLTPEKYDPSLTPEQRWKKFGLDPNGRLIDPQHME